jgi:hypothetical protein
VADEGEESNGSREEPALAHGRFARPATHPATRRHPEEVQALATRGLAKEGSM